MTCSYRCVTHTTIHTGHVDQTTAAYLRLPEPNVTAMEFCTLWKMYAHLHFYITIWCLFLCSYFNRTADAVLSSCGLSSILFLYTVTGTATDLLFIDYRLFSAIGVIYLTNFLSIPEAHSSRCTDSRFFILIVTLVRFGIYLQWIIKELRMQSRHVIGIIKYKRLNCSCTNASINALHLATHYPKVCIIFVSNLKYI